MITIVYSSNNDETKNSIFEDHLKKSIGVSEYEILKYKNFNEFSLAQVYNQGIEKSQFDIVVCCHNDVKLETGWGKKLISDFKNHPDYAIIGKAGSCYFPESGIYWERMHQTMVGQVYHHPEGQKKWLSKYSTKLPELIPVVTIDGLFIAFDKTKIIHKFDETIGKFHFYDHCFCLPNYLDGVKIGVTSSFDITHQSVGQPNREFFESKDKFLAKYKSILPLDLKPIKPFVEQIKQKPFKNVGKVAIIIPTKGKVEMLKDCVKSFYDNCDNKIFTIFIADTGSSELEKEWIKSNILPFGDIKLIEYDYYNFAKINNDVVKNYVTSEFEYLLFCNNDIKVMNDVIYNMLSVFKQNSNTGTVGARLHFEDGTVQHDGIIVGLDKNNQIKLSHLGYKSYYNYRIIPSIVIGSTGGLLMISKTKFKKCNMFNENYIECFEDVELNLQCEINGYTNFMCGSAVAYHLESKSRDENSKKDANMVIDFREKLEPFIRRNLKKIKNITILN